MPGPGLSGEGGAGGPQSTEASEKRRMLTSDVLLLGRHLVVVGRLDDGDVDVLHVRKEKRSLGQKLEN